MQLLQLFTGRAREGYELCRGAGEVGLCEFPGFAEGLVHRFNHHLLEFCPRETLSAINHHIQWNVVLGTSSAELQIEDRSTLLGIGKIQEENFIEPSLAQQLGG